MPMDLQQNSTMESPRQNQSFERSDFRDEYQIDPRGPVRGAAATNRPRSNNLK